MDPKTKPQTNLCSVDTVTTASQPQGSPCTLKTHALMYKTDEQVGTGMGGTVTIAAHRQNILRIQNLFRNEHTSRDI